MTEPLAELIIRELTEDISLGKLPAGERLDEVGLAKRFGVSRTPVREALRELAASGLIDNRERRGFVVSEVSVEELAEMFEAMSEVEALCAKLAAHRMTPFERIRLKEIHEKCRKTAAEGNAEAYIRLNEEFHEVIYDVTHNRFIVELARNFRRRTAPFRNRQFRDSDGLQASYESHGRIVEAIDGSRSEDAYSGMREHATASGLAVLRSGMIDRG